MITSENTHFPFECMGRKPCTHRDATTYPTVILETMIINTKADALWIVTWRARNAVARAGTRSNKPSPEDFALITADFLMMSAAPVGTKNRRLPIT